MVLLGFYGLCCHHSHVWLAVQRAADSIYPSRITGRCRHVSMIPNVHRTRNRSRELPATHNIHGVAINAVSRPARRCSANAEGFRKMPINVWLQHFELSISTQMSSYSLALRISSFLCAAIRIAMLFTSPCSQYIISPGGFFRDSGCQVWHLGRRLQHAAASGNRLQKLVLYPAHRCISKVSTRPTC